MNTFGKHAESTNARVHMAMGLYPYFLTLDGNDRGTARYHIGWARMSSASNTGA